MLAPMSRIMLAAMGPRAAREIIGADRSRLFGSTSPIVAHAAPRVQRVANAASKQRRPNHVASGLWMPDPAYREDHRCFGRHRRRACDSLTRLAAALPRSAAATGPSRRRWSRAEK